MPTRLAFILCWFLPLSALAGPAEVSRVLKSFDFEERRLGNVEDLPMGWSKYRGPGFPHYVNGQLTDDSSRSGQWSFRFDLNGGSLAYTYDPRAIRIRAGARYRIEGYVKTTILPHARARITAYFTNQAGDLLPNSVVHSDLFGADSSDDDVWHKLSVELSAQGSASFLVLQLELLQPTMYAPSPLGERTLFDEDIHGSAWWDDITVSQVPELVISSEHPGNVFRRSEPLRLWAMVNDRFTDDLGAQILVTDAAGICVYQHSGALDSASAQDMGLGRKLLAIILPDLSPGWYTVTVKMTSNGDFLGQQDVHVVRLPDDNAPIQPDPRFGVVATDLPFEGWSQLPDLLPMIGAARVKISVWNQSGDVEEIAPDAFDALLQRLQLLGIAPTACFTAMPPSIAQKIADSDPQLADFGGNFSDWTQLSKAAPEIWQPELSYLIARHAAHLDRWQFGDDKDAATFADRPELRHVYDLFYQQFSLLTDKPDLAMPWPAWTDMSGDLPATVALTVPPQILPQQLGLYVQGMRGHEGHNLSLNLQPLDSSYSRQDQFRDLVQRVTYALASGADRIDLPLPFSVINQNDHFNDDPQEMLLVIRNIISQLNGAAYRGKLPNTVGVEAFLFDRGGQGILVLWSGADTADPKKLSINLGKNATRVDLWGNASPILLDRTGKNNSVDLEIDRMPFFLLDVDSAIAQLRASVALDRPLLESDFTPHTRHILFNNPSKTALSGTLKLVAPTGWTLTPDTFSFNLDPGESFDHELSIEFPYSSFAGNKMLSAEFHVQSPHETNFTVPITISLGLSDVGMQTMAFCDKNDLLVQQMITNYGEHPINYSAYAAYPGQARQERLVLHLQPGRSTVKLYRFHHVQIIPDAKVRSGLREIEGTRVLNQEVEIQ